MMDEQNLYYVEEPYDISLLTGELELQVLLAADDIAVATSERPLYVQEVK